MRPKDRALAARTADKLRRFSASRRPLRGIATASRLDALLEQIAESVHRVQYIDVLLARPISAVCLDPNNDAFDPLKAAILRMRLEEIDEAFWLVFLASYCGKHVRDGWRLARDLYRGEGAAPWTWARTSSDPDGFRRWLESKLPDFRSDGVTRRFGNHRRYETLNTDSPRGAAAVVASYVRWVGANRGHGLLIEELKADVGADRGALFDALYQSMDQVVSFGRLGKFDLLTMLGKLRLAPIEPRSPYLVGATGPLRGARLLFGGSVDADIPGTTLDAWVVELGLELGLGMQVMEDALCNWQKSPDRFIPFRG